MSKGALEDKISRTLTQWEKEYLGRGPISVKTDIVRNMIIVVLKGILTPAEKEVAKTLDGLLSIKKIRSDLLESGSAQLKEIIFNLTGQEVVSMHTDISTKTGERVIVFILSNNLEEMLHKLVTG
ncbi:Na-translocating system protein MpsC family protein [Paranoxybacillus vitaminiphilus]